MPSTQHFCGAAQQAFFSSQHFIALSQQPSLAGAAQQAIGGAQHANFLAQHPFSRAAFFMAIPQQALASLQQSMPSTQHFCGAKQHGFLSAQHFIPFSQQPSLASAAQQAEGGSQHASFRAQQSFFSPCTPSMSPKAANTVVR
jgi:ureidoglycolate hydrolase